MVIVNDLFNPYSFGKKVLFESNDDAKIQLETFMREKVSGPILVVLDDVWSESFIEYFAFKIRGYKVLVTSRMVFPKYDLFQLNPLSDEDAKTIFIRSAFTESSTRPSPTINEDLVNQMVKCCKKHPLTLTVVGSSLKGKEEVIWRSMLRKLSQGRPLIDLHQDLYSALERSFESLDDELKQCFLDFGLFPEGQRIPASALLNMWVHLYNHDDEGNDTLATITRLSYKNLVNLITTNGFRNNSSTMVNYCEEQFVTQHGLLRELSIELSGKEPIAQRTRLIIISVGTYLPKLIEQVQEPMQARIVSISTGESFSSRWCNMKVPNVEVMVLNLMSDPYSLPHFFDQMQKLKILNVTNYASYPTQINNFNLVGCLSNLTRMRIEHVAISFFSRSVLALVNLQNVSFISCKLGKAFERLGNDKSNVWPQLVGIEIDYCHDLVEFPGMLCRSVRLKKLNITNCSEMCALSEEFGNLTSLETLSLRSCTKLEKLPESITRLKRLSVLDISDCLSLSELPEDIGRLVDLRTVYMKGCTGIYELPSSLEELFNTQVVCDEETSLLWGEFANVKIHVVEEDRLGTLRRVIGNP